MTIMTKIACWLFPLSLSLIFFILPSSAKEAPKEIAGIALGTSIDNYPEITRNTFLKEVEVTDWHGFRKGTVSYGTCKYVDQILKIL